MSVRSKNTRKGGPRQDGTGCRLELIRRRHRELILRPREAIAADYGDEFEDPFDEVLDADQMELAGMVPLDRF
ncbi:MAG: hypothetical protein AMK73_07695 [Planctomycetes bacterium SM23_32]|nr:MAG: hypothetical protein AMK73_07695 [Planctomycetes bacterium SM23_32]